MKVFEVPNKDFTTTLKSIADSIVLLELNMRECPMFKTSRNIDEDASLTVEREFNSTVMTTAFTKLVEARMFMNEILLILNEFKPHNYFVNTSVNEEGSPRPFLHQSSKVIWKEVVLAAEKERLKKANIAFPEGLSVGSVSSFVPVAQMELDCILFYKKYFGSAYDLDGIHHKLLCLKTIHRNDLKQYIYDKTVFTGARHLEIGDDEEAFALGELNKSNILFNLDLVLLKLSEANKYLGLRIGEIKQ